MEEQRRLFSRADAERSKKEEDGGDTAAEATAIVSMVGSKVVCGTKNVSRVCTA